MAALQKRKIETHDVDPLIPIMNLVCMLIPLLLYGAVFVRFVALPFEPPRIPRDVEPDPPADDLNLTVLATDQGFHIRVNPVHRMPWMSQADGSDIGPDVPRTDGGWDYDGLARRLEEIKRDHNRETRVILGAQDDVSFDVVIRLMDVCRGSGDRTLFPDVTLTRRSV